MGYTLKGDIVTFVDCFGCKIRILYFGGYVYCLLACLAVCPYVYNTSDGRTTTRAAGLTGNLQGPQVELVPF